MSRRKAVSLAILFLTLLLSAGCLLSSDKDSVESNGLVVYLWFEGGFWGLAADNGTHYEPLNLSPSFHIDRLRVNFKGTLRRDLGSFRMWGRPLELEHIHRLDDSGD